MKRVGLLSNVVCAFHSLLCLPDSVFMTDSIIQSPRLPADILFVLPFQPPKHHVHIRAVKWFAPFCLAHSSSCCSCCRFMETESIFRNMVFGPCLILLMSAVVWLTEHQKRHHEMTSTYANTHILWLRHCYTVLILLSPSTGLILAVARSLASYHSSLASPFHFV